MPELFSGAARDWKFTAKFIAFSIVFFILEFAFQFYINRPGDLYASAVRSFGLTGATFIALALLCSPIFRFRPSLAKYWALRRALGVAGFAFIFLHILAAMQLYFSWDVAKVYFSPNPFENPIVFGAISFIILIPIALTSTDWAMAKMGGSWKTVQRLVYFAFWAAVFHFLTINPPQLKNPAGYFLMAITALALLGELYWFAKTSVQKSFRGLGVLAGLVVILLYLIATYFAWLAK